MYVCSKVSYKQIYLLAATLFISMLIGNDGLM